MIRQILKRRREWLEYALEWAEQNPDADASAIHSEIYRKFGREWVKASFEVMCVAQEAERLRDSKSKDQ